MISLFLPPFIRNAIRNTPSYITVELVKHSRDDQAIQFLLVALHPSPLYDFGFIYEVREQTEHSFSLVILNLLSGLLSPYTDAVNTAHLHSHRFFLVQDSIWILQWVQNHGVFPAVLCTPSLFVLWFHQFVMTIMTITLLPTYCMTWHRGS